MSSQFTPNALQGWHNLDPSQVDLVQPQWYQGGCVGTQSCPCWGSHQVADLPNCPGFTQSYMQQASKCSVSQWVSGFQKVGAYSWNPNQIVIGAKSWCGGDTPAQCQSSDTGIWGYQQMINILKTTGARGVYMWDINDYFTPGYGTYGNSISDSCKWTNQIADAFNINIPSYTPSTNPNCANYSGPLASNCS